MRAKETLGTRTGRRSLTRREALGAGAAALAGLGSTCLTLDPDVTPVPDGSQTVCNPPACSPEGPPTWAIPASQLQTLWGDFFPRYVAWIWFRRQADPSTPIFDAGLVPPPVLRSAIAAYMGDAAGGQPEPVGSPFRRRLTALVDYLGTAPAIPVRFVGEGGFDLILSDAGIDLFAPPMPTGPTELLRYFEFRDTGRGTVGIPLYMEDTHTFNVQRPGGPSQVAVRSLDFPVDAAETCTLTTLTCLRRSLDQDRRAWIFTIQDYAAAVARARCWQLEGAVYRGIIEQLPRVVATKWREELAQCAGHDTYAQRWPHGIREIFKERLETSLPGPERMAFRVEPGIEDVFVTNRGLLFPDCGAAPTQLATMFQSISRGFAGNPVFTDTKRPDRGG